MARPKRNILSLVPADSPPRDALAQKLDELAISMADELKGAGFDIHDKTEALKALTSYFAATRGKGTGPAAPPDAFAGYRKAQELGE